MTLLAVVVVVILVVLMIVVVVVAAISVVGFVSRRCGPFFLFTQVRGLLS